jgi:hypothetical protein
MNTNYDELVLAAQRSDDDAARQLADAGVGAVPAIVAAMADVWISAGQLPSVLEQICRTAPSDVVLQVVDTHSYEAFRAGLNASARRPEAELRQGLLDRLANQDELGTRRAGIAEFLGEHGDTSVIPLLRRVFTESSQEYKADDDTPNLAVAAAEALAKLGSFEAGAYLVGLLAASYSPTRELAAKALSVAVGPGMTRALTAEAVDSSWDGRLAAVQALFLLRDVAAVDALVAAAACDDPAVSDNAVIGINDITGAEFSTSWPPEQVAKQWNDHRHDFREGVHYRLGKPLRVANLFDILENDPDRHDEVVEEIRVTTGVAPIDGSYPPETAADIAARFPAEGALYRWGHKVDLDALGR